MIRWLEPGIQFLWKRTGNCQHQVNTLSTYHSIDCEPAFANKINKFFQGVQKANN